MTLASQFTVDSEDTMIEKTWLLKNAQIEHKKTVLTNVLGGHGS